MKQFTPDQRTRNTLGPSTEFGALLKQLRAAAGLTQTELADRAQMSWRGIADLERGVRRSPYPSTVSRLATALMLSPVDRARLIAASGRTAADTSRPPLMVKSIRPPSGSFVGRERELEQIRLLLDSCGLLTLTGPPGVGKTRLAYEAVRLQADDFSDGAACVELATLMDPGMLAHAVASSLGISDRPHQPIVETLVNALRDRQLLLVLDNCEHVLESCRTLVDRLISACSHVRIIATSRAPMQLSAETLINVPPLSLADPSQTKTAVQLAQSEAARLFLYRCRALRPRFVLTDTAAATVADLCARLDGLPLAIELAAARIQTHSPEELGALLDDRFRLFRSVNTGSAPHHQTLLATLDWSYDILSDAERQFFRAMSVFIGGSDQAAVIEVCGVPQNESAIDVVNRLVQQSLVLARPDENGDVRYAMLESIRDYAQRRLTESAAEHAVRARHAAFYRKLVLSGVPRPGAENPRWLVRMDQEQANVRMALRWFIDQGDSASALQLAAATAQFWDNRGYLSEARTWLAEVLDAAAGRQDTLRLDALVAAAHLARRDDDYQAVAHFVDVGLTLERQIGDPAAAARLLTTRATADGFRGDFASARALHEQAIIRWRELDDVVGLAGALNNLSIACDQVDDLDSAREALTECITLARGMPPGRTLASALNNLGLLLHRESKHAEARPLIEESLAIARSLGDGYAAANALGSLGLVAHKTGDLSVAREMFDQSLALRRQSADRRGTAISLQNLGSVLLDLGEPAQAEFLLEESLDIFGQLGSQWGVADALETLACVAAARSDTNSAERRLEQAAALRSELGIARSPIVQAQLDRWMRR